MAIGESQELYFPTYDGNGNVSEYLNQSGAIVAHYEYSPFGAVTLEEGEKADKFNFRFSTKHTDVETQLSYYGYRYYDAENGSWLSRDPIEEQGGLNLYGFVGNNVINSWDKLGLLGCCSETKKYWQAHGFNDKIACMKSISPHLANVIEASAEGGRLSGYLESVDTPYYQGEAAVNSLVGYGGSAATRNPWFAAIATIWQLGRGIPHGITIRHSESICEEEGCVKKVNSISVPRSWYNPARWFGNDCVDECPANSEEWDEDEPYWPFGN